ncbi:MAG TPA: hypothetical protein VN803_04770 [Gemmatimonadales bacterium]|nr:hypothetical protein [Gemmatimonadales bacterium]
MRLFYRAGLGIVIVVAAAACNKDSSAPVDFENPGAVSSNLSSVDSVFDSDMFRSFNVATFMLDAATTAPAMRPTAALLGALRPKLERTGGQIFLPGLLQAHKLQALGPRLSVAAEQGAIIPDSLYGRVFEWNDTTDQYVFRGTTVPNLNGVRFILYAVGLDGLIFEPTTAIGTLDIVDQSTQSSLMLHVRVRNTAGTITYLDYTAELTGSQTSAQATASGTITNGLTAPNNKTLSFDETLTANQTGIRVIATFALNNPAITLMLNESLTVTGDDLIINADFRVIQNSQTIRTVGRITVNTLSQDVDISIVVQVDGHPVATISGDPNLPGTQWLDAGGEPLTIEDLAALDHLFDALQQFDEAVAGLFTPIGTFGNL